MKIVVLGASGGCGGELVTQAVEAGHSVVAVGRESSSLEEQDGVEIKRGVLTERAFLAECFAGADAVLSALGPMLGGIAPWNKLEAPGFAVESARAVVGAMGDAGVSRLVAISAGGVGDSYARVPGFFKFLLKVSALKLAYAELEEMERVYLDSGLDVVIPRPTGLTNGERTGKARVVERFTGGTARISRADVAGWMLAVLDEPSPKERTPIITITGA